MRKRILAFILTLVLVMGAMPVSISAAKATYSVEKAIEYAKNNWNSGQGLCAEFVSRCVKAGGLNVSIEVGTGNCYRAIMKASGLDRVTLKLDSKGYATKELNGDNLAAGDVVIQWCSTDQIAPHILLCGGYDSKGYATFYAHNGAMNNTRYNLGLNEAYQHTKKCDMGGQVIRLSTLDDGSYVPATPTVTVVPTTEAAYLKKAYVKDTDACVVTKITKPAGSNITQSGLCLYDENGTLIKEKSFDVTGVVGKNVTSFHSWYEINSEIGVKLTPGTVYKYKFFVVVDNTRYEGETYSFKTTGTAPVTNFTVTVVPTTESSYLAKAYVKETDACVVTKITKPAGSNITVSGLYLYDVNGNLIKKASFDVTGVVGKNVTSFHSWYEINSEIGITLTPGTVYKYKFFVVVDNTTYEGATYSFTTKGTAPVTKYTITYDANGGIGAPANQTKTKGSAMNLSTIVPLRENYKFLGWSTKSNSASVEYLPGGSYNIDKDIMLYAVWELIKAEPEVSEVHFPRVNVYFDDQFTDVPQNQWYTVYIAEAFELGIMRGNSATTFNPYGEVTIAEAITMASRIHSIYTTGAENFKSSDIWYQVYLDYAYENGIISRAFYNCDVTQKATRAQFAEIFANALPDEALAAINNVADDAIPDVRISDRYASSVYKLYRSGILAGSDANGTFNPQTYITRAEAATLVSRMAESEYRKLFTLNK